MSSQPQAGHDVSQEDVDLNFIRSKRYEIVNTLHDTQGKIPDDPEKLALMLSTLKDMSKDSLTKMRIRSDEKIAEGNTATLQLASQILSTVRVSQPPLPNATTVVELGVELPVPTILPGELDQYGKGENYVAFTNRMGM